MKQNLSREKLKGLQNLPSEKKSDETLKKKR